MTLKSRVNRINIIIISLLRSSFNVLSLYSVSVLFMVIIFQIHKLKTEMIWQIMSSLGWTFPFTLKLRWTGRNDWTLHSHSLPCSCVWIPDSSRDTDHWVLTFPVTEEAKEETISWQGLLKHQIKLHEQTEAIN